MASSWSTSAIISKHFYLSFLSLQTFSAKKWKFPALRTNRAQNSQKPNWKIARLSEVFLFKYVWFKWRFSLQVTGEELSNDFACLDSFLTNPTSNQRTQSLWSKLETAIANPSKIEKGKPYFQNKCVVLSFPKYYALSVLWVGQDKVFDWGAVHFSMKIEFILSFAISTFSLVNF